MRSRKWEENEVLLFYSDRTNQDIAMETGRTVDAVRKKRFMIDHGFYTKPADGDVVYFNPYKGLTKEEKINRIKLLAMRYHVRLKEE